MARNETSRFPPKEKIEPRDRNIEPGENGDGEDERSAFEARSEIYSINSVGFRTSKRGNREQRRGFNVKT